MKYKSMFFEKKKKKIRKKNFFNLLSAERAQRGLETRDDLIEISRPAFRKKYLERQA